MLCCGVFCALCVVGSKRFCPYCQQAQPVRSKHCYDCGKCVVQFDHHCSWVGTCIGWRNHTHFWSANPQPQAAAPHQGQPLHPPLPCACTGACTLPDDKGRGKGRRWNGRTA